MARLEREKMGTKPAELKNFDIGTMGKSSKSPLRNLVFLIWVDSHPAISKTNLSFDLSFILKVRKDLEASYGNLGLNTTLMQLRRRASVPTPSIVL